MSTIWLLSWLSLVLLLGQCQCQYPENVWAKRDALDVFAALPELTVLDDEMHTDNESHGNNVTLATAKEQDLLATQAAPLSQRKLSRGKRFVAFPVGSSASAAVCLTTGVLGNPNLLYFSLGINWGIAYDLPNITWVLQNAHGWNTKKPSAALAKIKRRHRRDLYGNLETMIDR